MTDSTSPRIRVVFAIGAMHGGGSERQLVLLLRHLDRTKFEPFLYLVYRSGPLLSLVPDDVPIASFEERVTRSRIYLPGLMHSRRVADYSRFLREVRADVSYDRTFLMTLITAAGAQKVGVPNVSTIVTDPEIGFAPVAGRFQWFKRRILHRLYNSSAQVLAVSDGARESAIRFYGIRPEKIRTLQNGVDTQLIREQSMVSVEHDFWTESARPPYTRVFRIVTAGRLNHEKGFHLLIDAVADVRQRHPGVDIRLAILGEGTHRETLQAQISLLKLDANVLMPGFQTNAPAWYRTADVFVLPSLMEGMPNVLLEAMSCGTPVVSSNCHSGPSEILDQGRLGELVTVNNASALSHGIERILSDPPSAIRRADNALRSVEAHWSIQSATHRLEEILFKVGRRQN